MSNPKYVGAEYQTNPLAPLAAGKTGTPENLPKGGVLGTGTIVFADNPGDGDQITLNGAVVQFTTAASDATAAGTLADPVLINIKGSLALTLDEMLVVLNDGSAPAVIAEATYTENGVDTLTATLDAYTYDTFVITSDGAGDTATSVTGQQAKMPISLETESTELSPATVAQRYTLALGDAFQRKTIYNSGTGDALVEGNFTGANVLLTLNQGEYCTLQMIGGEWKAIANTGALT